MSEFKGTRGKWIVKGRINIKIYSELTINGITLDYPICKIDDFDKSIIENNANAQLISCAPEMLEMLIKMREICDHMNMTILRNEVQELITKATTV